MYHSIADIIDLEQYPLDNVNFRAECKRVLDKNGTLIMRNFLKTMAISSIQREGVENQHLAYYTMDNHNIYLTQSDQDFPTPLDSGQQHQLPDS